VPSGAFSSSTPFGYALQDNSAGIYVTDSVAPVEGEFIPGELVTVSGIIYEINNLLVIREKTASKKGTGNEMIPVHVKTGNVNESHEGMVVNTGGVIDSLVSDLPYGYKIFINDGSGRLIVFVNVSAGFLSDTIHWRVSDSISVTGFLAQYGTKYEVEPWKGTDLKVFRNN
jgi:hypothetical protein